MGTIACNFFVNTANAQGVVGLKVIDRKQSATSNQKLSVDEPLCKYWGNVIYWKN